MRCQVVFILDDDCIGDDAHWRSSGMFTVTQPFVSPEIANKKYLSVLL